MYVTRFGLLRSTSNTSVAWLTHATLSASSATPQAPIEAYSSFARQEAEADASSSSRGLPAATPAAVRHNNNVEVGEDSSDENDHGANEGAEDANDSAPATPKLSTKKKEALSQVPCKFFRANGCSAGNSCPFAHILPGEGQGKAICQWFLKGSCRFGHRCALAHILPGQPMSVRTCL